MKNENSSIKTTKFSKDNHIVEISSKQSNVQIKNVIPPVKPKEIKKEGN